MKNIILIFVTASAVFRCTGQKPIRFHNDLYFDNLKGFVETIKEVPYTADSNQNLGAADSCCLSILAYDRKGYRTMDVTEDALGNGRNGQVYIKRYHNGKPKEIQFLTNGNVTSILLAMLTKDGNNGTAQIYDTTGKLISFYADVNLNTYGKIICMKSFTPDSAFEQTIINSYHKQIWVGGSIIDSNGRVIFSTVIKLNENLDPSKVMQTQVLNGQTSVTSTMYVYDRFDDHHNWIQRHELNQKGEVIRVVKREIRYRTK